MDLLIKSLKKVTPVPVRRALKYGGNWFAGLHEGPLPPRVPPRHKTFIGGGDFIKVGDGFLKAMQNHGLRPTDNILDVGCGQGRIARPLTDYLTTGNYRGFDIVKSGVRWCQTHYADMQNFEFAHANIYNKRYNKNGIVAAEDFRFPYDDAQFDFVILTSVFTHMTRGAVENYLSEIYRVMRPGSTSLITWFLLGAHVPGGKGFQFDFHVDVDAVSKTTVRNNPEAAIAFNEDYVRSLYQKIGFTELAIEHGYWSNRHHSGDFQDHIIAKRS